MTDMPSELKPCPNPWCWRPDNLRVSVNCNRWRVWCPCNLCGPEKPSHAEAIAAWNTRTALTDHQSAGEPVGEVRTEHQKWVIIAKAAGANGVRYRTNRGMMAFLGEVNAATLQKLAEVEGERKATDALCEDMANKAIQWGLERDALTAKLAEGREARLISETCAVKTQEMLMEILDAEKAELAKLTDMMVRYLKPETYVDVNGKAWPTKIAGIAFINDVIYTLDPPKP